MGNNPGRNDPCWCGSGKKYKKCHLERERSPKPTKQEVLTELRKPYDRKYCLHPNAGVECKERIVRAHTIQRNGGLSKIAEDGHVLHLAIDFSKPPGNPTLLAQKPIGLKEASTFTGFCGFHDNKTFEPIEKHSFQANQESTFLLGYRALCRELFGKRAQRESVSYQRTLDQGQSLRDQVLLQRYLNVQEPAVQAGLRDAENHKETYDQILLSSDYSRSNYYVISFGEVPNIMCSAVKFVTHDFNGTVLQNLGALDKKMDQITFSIIATDTGGAAVFQWVDNSSPCEHLVSSLDALSDEEISSAIVRFTFEFFENTFFSASWWNGLEERTRESLRLRLSSAIDMNIPRKDRCLMDDGLRPVKWPVIGRYKHIP